jgi:DUF1680 family protein
MSQRILLLAILILGAACFDSGVGSYPIQPVPSTEVEVSDSFWSPRIETNRQVTVWYDFEKSEETGRIRNFEVAGGLEKGGFQGIFYNDSDVYKIIEGASYMLQLEPDKKLDNYLDDLIKKIAAAQEDDGYLYTARTIDDPGYKYRGKEARWFDMKDGHELYNVGHLYEAAVAHYRATEKRTLLDVAVKNADLVCEVFGPDPNQLKDPPGHQEIEIGLVRLFLVTGTQKYLDQARFFLAMRGRSDLRQDLYGESYQDHAPVVLQEEARGHAVRAGYMYAGMADVAALTGDNEYITAIGPLWNDVVGRKMYLTGNVGHRKHHEGYTEPYDLDNILAYNETCAAIALAMWNHRMFLLHGDSRYMDVFERTLYNGFLAGVSFSGDRFFYPNPLACDMQYRFNHGSFERSPWFKTSCCPVNVVRFIPSLPGYIYAKQDNKIYVNLYISGSSTIELPENLVTIKQQTDYPWNGVVNLVVEPDQEGRFVLCLRIPCWGEDRPLPSDLYQYLSERSGGYQISVNGEAIEPKVEKGYAVVDRRWSSGDEIELKMAMVVNRVTSDERVAANRGRVAIERGPLVYCVEGVDHQDGDVMQLYLPDDAELAVERRDDLLNGVTILKGAGGRMMRKEDGTWVAETAAVTMIPYYAWCHRGANQMQVWIPRSADGVNESTPGD